MVIRVPPIQLTYFKKRLCLLIIQSLTRKTARPARGNSNAAVFIVLSGIAISDITMKRIIVRYPLARCITPSIEALVAVTSCRPLIKLVAARTIPILDSIIETFVNINILGPESTLQYSFLNKIRDDTDVCQNQRHYHVNIRPCRIVDQAIVAALTNNDSEPVPPHSVVLQGVVTRIPKENSVPSIQVDTVVRQIIVIG